MKIYKTVQGDCWDLIAFKLYGNERYMKLLAEANPPLLDIMVFPSGTEINVPDIPENYEDEETVFWRKPDTSEPYSSVVEVNKDE